MKNINEFSKTKAVYAIKLENQQRPAVFGSVQSLSHVRLFVTP